jgi:hypothetical protein
MAIVRFRADEVPPLSEEGKAGLWALAERPDSEIDFGEIPETTDEEWARSVRASDYPSEKEAMAEARRLHDMQMAGMTIAELESYKASRAGPRVAQAAGV